MDAKSTNVKPWPKQGLSDHVRAAPAPVEPRPSREQAEAAVRTLIAYAGDDPTREGLLETPKGVEAVRRRADDVEWLFLMNHNAEPAAFAVPEGWRFVAGDEGTLPPYGVAVLSRLRSG